MRTSVRPALLACVLLCLYVPAAGAVRIELLKQGVVEAGGVTGAADGSVWMRGVANTITHITTGGEYGTGSFSLPYPGPGASNLTWHDEFLWVTRPNGVIERYAPGGTLVPIEATSGAVALTPAADRSMWFLRPVGNQLGRVAPDGNVTLFGGVTPGALADNAALTFGPDGNLWFTEPGAGMVGRMTPQGAITEFPLPAGTQLANGIAAGSDGHVYLGLQGAVGRMTTSGLLTARLTGGRTDLLPERLIAARDGNLWFTHYRNSKLMRMRLPDGRVDEHAIGITGPTVWPTGLQQGPDRTLWFYEWWGGKAGRVLFDPPRAATADASVLPDGRVRLSGTAAGRGVDTRVVFEYGTTTDYGSTTEPLAATDAEDSAPVAAITAPLTPGTTYHYRIVAQSAVGRVVGDDRMVFVPGAHVEPEPLPPVVIALPDHDGDGFPAGVDCDDRASGAHPGAVDRPGNRIDEDCSGADAPYPRFEPRIQATWNTHKRYVVFNRFTIEYMPAKARLRLSCSGKGCRVKSYAASMSREVRGLDLLKRLKGSRLRKNAVVELRLSRPGHVTTITRWKMGPPARRTVRCLAPNAKQATKCP